MRELSFVGRARFLWLIAMVAALLFGIANVLFGVIIAMHAGTSCNEGDAVNRPSAAAAPTPTTPPRTTPPSVLGATTPSAAAAAPGGIVFTGRGGKATEAFYIAGTSFRVRWTTETDDPRAFFFLSVYQEGQDFATAEASFTGAGSDSTVVRAGPAYFYIEVITGAAWQVEVIPQ